MNSPAQRDGAMLRDVSARPRFGCKGPMAEAWLHELGLSVPQPPNSWSCEQGDVLVARLATSEFLVESLAPAHARTREIAGSLLDPGQRRTGLVPVLRQDLVLELRGARANDLLLETCNVNFAPLARNAGVGAGSLVMTSMIGVGVTVIPRRAGGEVTYTIWCDPSFGHYMYSTLAGIADDLSGMAVS
ncbi:MAG: methylglutamate dehydrogenase [Gammaproteobacteria bacterium]|nr:methylglutamate dehydrogenase [Gammaproteobacteria bacterium]